MSRLLGQPVHQCYVYPDFDAALEKFAAGGIGPFFLLGEVGGMGDYRGEQHEFSAQVAFVYSGDNCFEIISPKPGGISAYNAFLDLNPHGGLHHIAYYSEDFAKTLAAMEAEGKPLRIVQEFVETTGGDPFEIYCEPVGVENPLVFQFLRPGVFDAWFDAMRDAAANWDGTDPIRDASHLLAEALAEGAG